jgi:hypothetical protein
MKVQKITLNDNSYDTTSKELIESKVCSHPLLISIDAEGIGHARREYTAISLCYLRRCLIIVKTYQVGKQIKDLKCGINII